MNLWNEYEGRSIDGLFPLERLIRPEGRSAFFSTTTSGISTVIRLIESHFDEDEILARWTGVSDLHQPNLLTLTRFGQAMMDETSLVYVVLEPTEADLGQILCDRPLTLAETRQVAASLIPALQALHAKGFIHEHIQSGNVLAVGEVVKLRSDCIREAPEGPEGDALRSRDVQDLATLLLYALTQQRSQNGSPNGIPAGPPLPAPFREIIHNGISRTWSLWQMAAALEATAPQTTKALNPVRPVAVAAAGEEPRKFSPNGTPVAQNQPVRELAGVPNTQPSPEPAGRRILVPLRQPTNAAPRWLALLAVGVVCLVLFAAYSLLHSHAEKSTDATPPIASNNASLPVATTVQTADSATAKTEHESTSHEAGHSESWRVVAYTYNRQDQAAAKARTLEQHFAELHPSVFTPTGRAPYLVTMGGLLSRDEAFRLRDKLRRSGLPRDVYTQNYISKDR